MAYQRGVEITSECEKSTLDHFLPGLVLKLSRSARQVVIFLHEMFALISITLIAGHIYMATLNPSTRYSLRGMLGGWVRRDWAAAHHAKWVAATDATSSQHGKQPE